jgi:hypothetical protein
MERMPTSPQFCDMSQQSESDMSHNADVGSEPLGPGYNMVPIAAQEPCWLCNFCTNDLAKKLTVFINEQITEMDLELLCTQIEGVLLEQFNNAEGASVKDIHRHITLHMVSPNVKICNTIRAMSAVSDAIRLNIFKRDEENGMVVMDKASAELYLKFTAQIASLYKVDPSKTLFAATTSSQATPNK